MALAAWICSLSASCGEFDPTARDAALAQRFEMDRAGFQGAVDLMTAEPMIQSVDLATDGSFVVQPANAEQGRVQVLVDFMEKQDIEHIGASPTGAVGFNMYGSGIGASGQAKSILFSQSPPDGLIVPDTDVEMAKQQDQWRVVSRRLDENWYIENSCC